MFELVFFLLLLLQPGETSPFGASFRCGPSRWVNVRFSEDVNLVQLLCLAVFQIENASLKEENLVQNAEKAETTNMR